MRREQVGGRDDQPRRAEPALHRARLDERLLHPVQPIAVREPLDRRHLVPVGLRGEHEARADERPVEQHRARAALALLARVLRAREAEPSRSAKSSDSPSQQSASCSAPLTRSVILMRAPGSSARSASTRSAWRR